MTESVLLLKLFQTSEVSFTPPLFTERLAVDYEWNRHGGQMGELGVSSSDTTSPGFIVIFERRVNAQKSEDPWSQRCLEGWTTPLSELRCGVSSANEAFCSVSVISNVN